MSKKFEKAIEDDRVIVKTIGENGLAQQIIKNLDSQLISSVHRWQKELDKLTIQANKYTTNSKSTK